jgi:hypothetical protein
MHAVFRRCMDAPPKNSATARGPGGQEPARRSAGVPFLLVTFSLGKQRKVTRPPWRPEALDLALINNRHERRSAQRNPPFHRRMRILLRQSDLHSGAMKSCKLTRATSRRADIPTRPLLIRGSPKQHAQSTPSNM